MKLPLGLRGIRVANRDVPGPPSPDRIGDFPSRRLLIGADGLQDARPMAGPQVIHVEARPLGMGKRCDVTFREVDHVEVVPHTGPVLRPVVVPVDGDALADS